MNELVKLKKLIEIKKWLDSMYIIPFYTINDDLTVDSYHNVDLNQGYDKLTEIPIQFGKIYGAWSSFWVSNNNLTSLKGCPEYVGGQFSCYGNRLTSLEYCPRYIGRDFDCGKNQLTSLEGAPRKPYDYRGNPCAPIYDKLDWTKKAHAECRKVWI